MKNLHVFMVVLSLAFYKNATSQVSNLIWATSFGDPGGSGAYAVTADGAGNVYTIGGFQGFIDLDPGPGVYNLVSPAGIFISKLDASGNFVWGKCLGSPNAYYGYAIAVDPAGNVYTTGQYSNVSDFDPGPGVFNMNGSDNVFICKLDVSGNFVWAKSVGGNGNDKGHAIVVDSASNVYVTGYYDHTADFDPGPGVYSLTTNLYYSDVFVLKLNSAGNFAWAKNMGGDTSSDYGFGIALDNYGNVYTAGYFNGPADFDPGPGVYNLGSSGVGPEAFISKLDTAGNFIWAKSYTGNGATYATGIKVDAGGNIFTTGVFQFTADFDPNAGMYNLTATGEEDIFIAKMNAAGNFIWAKNMGGTGCNNRPYSIALDQMSNVYSTGVFNKKTDFDPDTTFYTIATTGKLDWNIFISKLDSSGNFVWAGNIGADSTYEVGQGIATDALGNVYVCGYFELLCDADPGPGNYPLTSSAYNDAFVIKLNNNLVDGVIEKQHHVIKISLYPNPNNGTFTLQCDDDIKSLELMLINQLGQKLHSQKLKPGLNTIQINSLAKGMYYYSVSENKTKIESGKIVIE